MSALNRGVSLLKANKFKEALEEFQELIKNSDLDVEEKISSYKYVIKINKILNNPIELIENKWSLITFNFQNNKIEASYDLLNELTESETQSLYNVVGKSRYYEFLIDVLVTVGEVEKSKAKLKAYLEHLVSKRSYVKGLEVISKYSGKIIKEAELLRYIIAFYTFQNNETGLSTKLNEILALEEKDNVANCFDAMTEFDFKINSDKTLQEIYLKGLLDRILNDKAEDKEVKSFISKCYEYVLNYPQEYLIYQFMIYYAHKKKKKGLLQSLKAALEGNKIEYKKSKKNKDFHEMAFSLTENLEEDEDIDVGTIDLADELFGRPEESLESEEQKVRDIAFLRSIGDEAGAEKIEKELKNSDDKEETKTNLINLNFSKIDLDEYEKGFEKEIRKILRKTTSNSESNDMATMYLSLVKEKILDDENIDVEVMISTFYTFGFHKEGVKYIDFVLSEFEGELEESKEINLKFQKALLLKELNKQHQAIDILEEAVSESPLVDYEELAHLYLLGECYMSIGRKGNALKIYKLINNKMPGYRQVKDRISTIESNK